MKRLMVPISATAIPTHPLGVHRGVCQSRMVTATRSGDVLEFWFGSTMGATPTEEQRKQWWEKDPAFDQEIRDRFGALFEQACAGQLDDWGATPRGTLALVILLDQFSRNLYRGDPRSWAHDAKAQSIVRKALDAGQDESLSLHERVFLYMPLMHAEDVDAQLECIEQMKRLVALADEGDWKLFEANLDYAHRHHVIVERFGRFPHRNDILGRASTPEEVEFLTQPGSSF